MKATIKNQTIETFWDPRQNDHVVFYGGVLIGRVDCFTVESVYQLLADYLKEPQTLEDSRLWC